MTRPIKFRAWNGKEMKQPTVNMLIQSTNGYPFWQFGFQEPEPMNDCILMQFTGLLDKNGKEIYEGDIVEWSIYEDAQETVDGIEAETWIRDSIGFSNGCFKVEKRTELLFNMQAPHRKLEIIGNIYENPELLK